MADPTPADWTQRLFDTLAVISTPHGPAFDRWFMAAIERKDAPQALEVSERAKRERFLTTLPLGGRLLALRAVLEAPAGELSPQAALERQQLAANFPQYGPLGGGGGAVGGADSRGVAQAGGGGGGAALVGQLDDWSENVAAREQMLLAMALAPVPSTMMFPPLRTTEELKKSLAPGEALVVFHTAGGNLFGFLVSSQTEHVWLLGEAQQVQQALAEWLRVAGELQREPGDGRRGAGERRVARAGGEDVARVVRRCAARFGRRRPTWRSCRTVGCGICRSRRWCRRRKRAAGRRAESNAVAADAMLIERVPMHYGPTASLAVGDRRAFRPTRHTGIVANELAAAEAKGRGGEGLSLAPLEDAVKGPVRLVPPLAQPGYLFVPLVDQLVVLDDVEVSRNDPYGWSPLPKSRGKSADSLAAWMGLPYEGPERMVLTGLPTAAETGLKVPARRGDAAAAAPGSEIFDSVCALMASGTRTVLVSRWRTGGQMNLQLVREFVQELQQSPADVAWQRSVMLARETPLDAAQEPRLKRLAEGTEPPGADHPFFWAGYLLVDTGTGDGEEASADSDANANAAAGAKAVAPPAAKAVPPVLPPQSELKPPGEAPAKRPTADADGEYK